MDKIIPVSNLFRSCGHEGFCNHWKNFILPSAYTHTPTTVSIFSGEKLKRVVKIEVSNND